MVNTKIVYSGVGGPSATSILRGELTSEQMFRLRIGSMFDTDLIPCLTEFGLAHLSHNGAGVRLDADQIVATLEPATNPRVDAAQFYTRVVKLFAGQASDKIGFTDGHERVTKWIKAKKMSRSSRIAQITCRSQG